MLSLIAAAPITALLSMIISYLVVKRRFRGRGFYREAIHAGRLQSSCTVLGCWLSIRGFSSGVMHM